MKKIGIIVFVVCIVIGLAFANFFSAGRMTGNFFNFKVNFKGVHGSGHVASERRDITGFTSVDVSGVFQVEIVAGSDYSVEVVADDNLFEYVSTDVHGKTLKIELNKKVSTGNDMIVRITAPMIDSIEATGASRVKASGIAGESFNVDSSGASKIIVEGDVTQLNVEVSGASNINAEGLKSVNAKVEASGASHVDVNVSGELQSEATGASRITYAGEPKTVNNRQSGAGSVSKK